MSTRINWYKTPVDRETLKLLTTRRNGPAFAQAFAHLLLYCLTTALALIFFLTEMWPAMAISAYFHSMFLGFLGYGAAVHELSHGTPFKTKWLNALFFRLFGFLTWNNIHHFKESHTGHHAVTAYDDEDFEIQRKPMPFTWRIVFGWFTFDWRHFKKQVFTTVQYAFGNTDPDYFWWNPLIRRDTSDPKKQQTRKRMIRWARTILVGHLLLLLLFIYFRLWILIYTVTFGSFFVTFLVKGCTIQQHSGLPSNIPDWRVTSYTADFGPLLKFLYWNINYHIEHHMYAAVPFYNLPKLRRVIGPDLPTPIHGFLNGVRHIRRVRAQQKKDPSYRFMQEFPPSATPPRGVQ